MRQIQNIAFFSILAFPAIQLHCFFERTIVAGVFRVHSIPGLRSFLTYPGLLMYAPQGQQASPDKGQRPLNAKRQTPQTLRPEQAADNQTFQTQRAKNRYTGFGTNTAC